MNQTKGRILAVGRDRELLHQLQDVLSGEYHIIQSYTFEDALSEILLGEFEVVITETRLPDLSGMDLLAVVRGMRPGTPVMIIDETISAKAAVAAMRLGASDYLHKPVNMQLLLMQIERLIETAKHYRPVPLPATTGKSKNASDTDEKTTPDETKPSPPSDMSGSLRPRPRHPNPNKRPATLLLNREQFQKINLELSTLLNHIKAHFVGLIDAEGNLAGASGTLEDYDLVLLTRALSIDHTATDTLARMLDEHQFNAAYLEGDTSGVYIVEIREPYHMSLAVITGTEVKPGMVWLYSKRAAENIGKFLADKPVKKTETKPLQIESMIAN